MICQGDEIQQQFYFRQPRGNALAAYPVNQIRDEVDFQLVLLQEEFLLSGPTDTLGMFVTSHGTSLRPPLSWTDGLITLGYSFPYVVAVGRGSITVYRYV